MKENAREVPQPACDWTNLYLIANATAFCLLWLVAMGWLSFFDFLVVMGLVAFTEIGVARGGVKEFFGFIGAFTAFLFSINAYPLCLRWTGFKFFLQNPLWAELIWFFILLGISLGLCQLMSSFMEKSLQKASSLKNFNNFMGGAFGFLKGSVLGYLLVLVLVFTNLSRISEKTKAHFHDGFCQSHHLVNFIEKRWQILENIDKMELTKRISSKFQGAEQKANKEEIEKPGEDKKQTPGIHAPGEPPKKNTPPKKDESPQKNNPRDPRKEKRQ